MNEWSRIARRIRVPLGFVFAVLYLWLARPTWQFLWLGLIGVVPGLLVRALASGHVRKNEVLATSGPYAYTRNPLYLGSFLIGVGFAVAAQNSWIIFALIVYFFAIYIPVIRREEIFLRENFSGFDEYVTRVPRLFPRLTPGTTVDAKEGPGFSWKLYLQHREYNALLGALVICAVLVTKMLLLKS